LEILPLLKYLSVSVSASFILTDGNQFTVFNGVGVPEVEKSQRLEQVVQTLRVKPYNE
jgi:hypothetical protein